MGIFLILGVLFLIFSLLWGNSIKKAKEDKRITTIGTIIKVTYTDSYSMRYRIRYQELETGTWSERPSYSYQRFKSKQLKSGQEVVVEYCPTRRVRYLYIIEEGMVSVSEYDNKILLLFSMVSIISFIVFGILLFFM